jgi:cytosine/adenosine deaminase-related metal-dependent hydrolase
MRLAALLPGARGGPGSLSAFEIVRMATSQGAAALSLGGPEGFAAGARADFAILDPEAGWALPADWSPEPWGAIVYAMGRENVSETVVDGIVRYRRGDPSVAGLKPEPDEVREAVRSLRTRMREI